MLCMVGYTHAAVSGGWWTDLCTTRGMRGGHQLWPWVVPPLPPSLERALATYNQPILPSAAQASAEWLFGVRVTGAAVAHVAIYTFYTVAYFGLLLPLALYKGEVHPIGKGRYLSGGLRRGRLAQLAVILGGPALVLLSASIWGAEFASVWCWGASACLLVMVLEPTILPRLVRLDALRAADMGHHSMHEALGGGGGDRDAAVSVKSSLRARMRARLHGRVRSVRSGFADFTAREFVGATGWVSRNCLSLPRRAVEHLDHT